MNEDKTHLYLSEFLSHTLDFLSASASEPNSYDVNEAFIKLRELFKKPDFLKSVSEKIWFELYLNKHHGMELVLEQKTVFSLSVFPAEFDIAKVQSLADAGDANSQFTLAEWYVSRQENYKKAFALYQQAAEQGHSDAKIKIIIAYWFGRGVKKNIPTAINKFKEAAEANCSLSCYYLAKIYYHGLGGVNSDFSTAIQYLNRSLTINNNTDALRLLAECYYIGKGVDKDLQQAIELYTQAAKLGDKISCYNAAILSLLFSTSLQHLFDAVEFLTQSASDNTPQGMRALGLLYSKGVVVEANPTQGLQWLIQAAEQQDPFAQFYLALEYIIKGRPMKDYEALILQAAMNNIFFAQFLAFVIAETKNDRVNAENWINKLIEHPIEQYKSRTVWQIPFMMMNVLLFENRTKQQKKNGLKLAEYLVDNNIRMGSLLLANFYGRGHIVKKDLPKANQYCSLYANSQKIESLLNIGQAGEQIDENKSILLFENAANLGSEMAHCRLGNIFLKRRDFINAYKHFKQVADIDHFQRGDIFLGYDATFQLGRMLLQHRKEIAIEGVCCIEQGMHYLKKAEQLGHPEAGSIYYEYLGAQHEDRTAVIVEFRQMAMTGVSAAMLALSRLCFTEQESLVIGLFWLKRARYLGNQLALSFSIPHLDLESLPSMFFIETLEQEIEHWRKLAVQSHPGAIAVLNSANILLPPVQQTHSTPGKSHFPSFLTLEMMRLSAESAFGRSDILYLDLHGFSVKQAEESVRKCIINGYRDQKHRVRIVTGRGNHVNTQGKRGTIYDQCEIWLNNKDLKDKLEEVQKRDGHYEILLKKIQNPDKRLDTSSNDLDEFYRKALPEWEQAANQNDPNALLNIGCAYLMGLGGYRKNEKKATEYMLKSAQAGNPVAQQHMATAYSLGHGVRQSDEQALHWNEKAAINGCPFSQFNFALTYLMGWGVDVDINKAMHWLTNAAQNGHPQAMRRLAGLYYFGNLVPKDTQQALKWYIEADKAGDAYSSYNLGCHYENGVMGERTEESLKLAFEAYLRSANGNDPDGALAIGRCYLEGIGTQKNREEAYAWLTKATELGQPDAYNILANYYLDVDDLINYEACLRKGASLGSMFSQVSLLQSDILKDDNEFFDCFDEISQHAFSELVKLATPLKLSISYYLMLNTERKTTPAQTKKNQKKGLKLLNALAEKGYSHAYTILGELYSKDGPFPTNWNKALEYWRKGAKLKNDDCLGMLGSCHEHGYGVAVNLERAKYFYQQAEALDSPFARCKIGSERLNTSDIEIGATRGIVDYFKETFIIIEKKQKKYNTLFSYLSSYHIKMDSLLFYVTFIIGTELIRLIHLYGENRQSSLVKPSAEEAIFYLRKITDAEHGSVPPAQKTQAQEMLTPLEALLKEINALDHDSTVVNPPIVESQPASLPPATSPFFNSPTRRTTLSLKGLLEKYNLPADTQPANYGTLLRRATANGYIDDVRYCIEILNIDINATDSNPDSQKTALHIASTKGYVNIIKYLLAHKADVTLKDAAEKTAWDYAQEHPNPDIQVQLHTLLAPKSSSGCSIC